LNEIERLRGELETMSDTQIEATIRASRDALIYSVYEAYKRRLWENAELHDGRQYSSFAAYLRGEFGTKETTSYDVALQAQVMFELESLTGSSPNHAGRGYVSKRTARALGSRMDNVRERVEQGESLDFVIQDEAAKRAEERQQLKEQERAEQQATSSDFEHDLRTIRMLDQIGPAIRRFLREIQQRPLTDQGVKDALISIIADLEALGMVKALLEGTENLDAELERFMSGDN